MLSLPNTLDSILSAHPARGCRQTGTETDGATEAETETENATDSVSVSLSDSVSDCPLTLDWGAEFYFFRAMIARSSASSLRFRAALASLSEISG